METTVKKRVNVVTSGTFPAQQEKPKKVKCEGPFCEVAPVLAKDCKCNEPIAWIKQWN